MRTEIYQQFAIVASDSAQQLADQLNAKLYELRDKNPVVTFEGLIARISYDETTRIKDCIQDDYYERGVRLSCQDCPLFSPVLKRDGTEDKRIKWGDCPHKEFGRTYRDSSACDKLFQMINSGEVRLCLADSIEEK